mmetsp:Transcript_29039/g.74682  ORF Transcript_29039/g.74682 Transcript_29039/m.74682 type:complete len:255 (+) Transcript_29039:42-806(+)
MLLRSRSLLGRSARTLCAAAQRPPKDIGALITARSQAMSEAHKSSDPSIYQRLGSSQSPNYLWIGCSDSRVSGEAILGAKLGELFVHRNIANQALSNDNSVMSVLQYSVDVLEVPHIIVCGHYDCGGVRAAMKNADHGAPLENWLRNIRDVYRLHRDELDAIADDEARHRRLVELNVVEQCLNLFKTGTVQRRRRQTFAQKDDYSYTQPRIHAVVYDPANGALKHMPIDFRAILDDIRTIYELYDEEYDGTKSS